MVAHVHARPAAASSSLACARSRCGQGGLGGLGDGGHGSHPAASGVSCRLAARLTGILGGSPDKITSMEGCAGARPPRTPDHPDRRRTASAQSPGLLPYRRLPAGHPRPDRAATPRTATPTPRSPAGSGVTVDTVRRWRGRYADAGPGRAGRPAPLRAGRPGSPRSSRRGQSPGLPATGRDRGAAVDGGAAPTWPAKSSAGASPRRSRPPPSAGSWPPTRSSPGSTSPGSSSATRTSPPRPPACSDLYARICDGIPLGDDEYVISTDEKTSIQARCRCHPTLPPGAARTMRVNHEYQRGGALAYLAAYDVHHARVFGHCSRQDRHRAVHDPGRAGHDPRAVRLGEAGVLGRRQRLLPPRPGRDRPARASGSRTRSWSTPRSTPPG